MITILLPLVFVLSGSPPPITVDSLLAEMLDRSSLARFPNPAYTTRQFSSYDRASAAPDKDGWFANNDSGNFLRTVNSTQLDAAGKPARTEFVMLDAEGPGAVVRFWSADNHQAPTILRIYIDAAADAVADGPPTIEVPLNSLFNGLRGDMPTPLVSRNSGAGNCFIPIPYAKRCVMTFDHPQHYYQINTRTYQPGTLVESLTSATLSQQQTKEALVRAAAAWTESTKYTPPPATGLMRTLAPGESHTTRLGGGGPSGEVITMIVVGVNTPREHLESALRTTAVSMTFDAKQTVWCPLGDFFGCGIGLNPVRDWYRTVAPNAEATGGTLACWWVMPFREEASITLTNHGDKPVQVSAAFNLGNWHWNDDSLYFHAGWRQEHPISTKPGAGTSDWNYIQIEGQGVYVGDNLAVVNPVEAWWGEGDEKITIDGEAFPSHFGTGTEDYYGYGWCSPERFIAALHSQIRCDGGAGRGNWGHNAVTRLRALDAIPFTKSFNLDMEVWHWAKADVGYAATTYWYARPDSTSKRGPAIEEARQGVIQPAPLPPPFAFKGAFELEKAIISAKSDGLTAVPQDMRSFARGKWSGEQHLWVQGKAPGAFVELQIPAIGNHPRRLMLHATRSWDYGIVRVSVNGQVALESLDLFSGSHGKVEPTGPIDLGVYTPTDNRFFLRVEVTGGNAKADGTRSFIGLDCVTFEPSPHKP